MLKGICGSNLSPHITNMDSETSPNTILTRIWLHWKNLKLKNELYKMTDNSWHDFQHFNEILLLKEKLDLDWIPTKTRTNPQTYKLDPPLTNLQPAILL